MEGERDRDRERLRKRERERQTDRQRDRHIHTHHCSYAIWEQLKLARYRLDEWKDHSKC